MPFAGSLIKRKACRGYTIFTLRLCVKKPHMTRTTCLEKECDTIEQEDCDGEKVESSLDTIKDFRMLLKLR